MHEEAIRPEVPIIVPALRPLVSVVIPCFNQAEFLGEAIESVLRQTYRNVEIVVVDDDSSDGTRQVAESYDGVRYVHQPHGGLATARNTGLRASRGEYVVFLDADDRLREAALETGFEFLSARPNCALVSGHYVLIGSGGGILPRRERPCHDSDHYTGLLNRNYIGMIGTVMHRRTALEAVQGFDSSLPACEDYDLYFRIARRYEIACHHSVVAEYRQHPGNMTRDTRLMLETAMRVMKTQLKHARRSARSMEAYRNGVEAIRTSYGEHLANEVQVRLKRREWLKAARGFETLLRLHPAGFAKTADILLRRLFSGALGRSSSSPAAAAAEFPRPVPSPAPAVPWVRRVDLGDLRRLQPIGAHFGSARGRPVDRHYIEAFLGERREAVRGRVLEIGHDAYTVRFGGVQVERSDVLHLDDSNPRATFVGDLTNAPQVPSDTFDCVILTQVLHLIFDTAAALRTVHRILKPGGTVLASFPGISQTSEHLWDRNWCWSFTTAGARRMFGELFAGENVHVEARGNALAATAFLHGIAAQELSEAELDASDPGFELVVLVAAVKGAGA